MSDRKTSRSRRQAVTAALLGLAGAGPSGCAETWAPARERVGGCIRSGHLLFLSGIGGWYPDRRPDGPLEKAGSSMANVLKVQVSLVDPENNWQPMNEVCNTFFPEPRPVRSYFGATGFRRPGQLLQIDCIAYVE